MRQEQFVTMRRALFARKTLVTIVPEYPLPKWCPAFYLLKVSFGYGMYADKGKHAGAGLGQFFPESGRLELYLNFRAKGGLAWQGPKRTFILRRSK